MDQSDSDDKIVREAKKRHQRAADHENYARTNARHDERFVEGDAVNNYQWDQTLVDSRQDAQLPVLTINKTRQHCLQIVNEARQNKAQIRVNATGNGATYEAAQIIEGIVRMIEYRSNAMETYDSGVWSQVTRGWGYWRLVTEYVSDDSDEQEIFIRRTNMWGVYLDPDIEEFDGADARYCVFMKDVPRDEFRSEYPDLELDLTTEATAGYGGWGEERDQDPWNCEDHVRVAEYFRRVQVEVEDENAEGEEVGRNPEESIGIDMDEPSNRPATVDGLTEAGVTGEGADDGRLTLPKNKRKTVTKIEWFKICGSKIVDRTYWPGAFIPFIRIIGEETLIDGRLDRKGHCRALIDPQRMLNVAASTAAQEIAMAARAPWVVAAGSINGYEEYWKTANTRVYPYLPWRNKDEQGNDLPPPSPTPPKQISSGLSTMMSSAENEMMMATGQYQAQMGENENAKSGVAINARQRQGQTATYHYIDHQAQAIRFTAKQIIELITRVYDTHRVIEYLNLDGSRSKVHIDPNLPTAHQKMAPTLAVRARFGPRLPGEGMGPVPPPPGNPQNVPGSLPPPGIAPPDGGQGQLPGAAPSESPYTAPLGMSPITDEEAKYLAGDPDLAEKIITIFNPCVGKYDVQGDVGPDFATSRQQAFDAIADMIGQNRELAQIAGDLLFRNADFPDAQTIAERIRRTISPAVLGTGPSPAEIHLQQQVQALQQQFQEMVTKLTEENHILEKKVKDKGQDLIRENYRAETDRLKALGSSIDPVTLMPVIRQLVEEVLGTPPAPLMNEYAVAQEPGGDGVFPGSPDGSQPSPGGEFGPTGAPLPPMPPPPPGMPVGVPMPPPGPPGPPPGPPPGI